MGVLDDIQKQYKTASLVTMGDKESYDTVESIPTSVAALDQAIGCGGLPCGRITELFGPEHSGKSSLSLAVTASAQERNPEAMVMYIDVENALDRVYARKCGVQLNRLAVVHPEYGEQAFDIAEKGIRSGEFPVVVFDSVPAISPRAEMEGDIGDAHIGLLPRLMSQFLRRNAFAIRESGVVVLFTNQIRDKISRYGSGSWETPGGHALKHYASVRIALRSEGEVKMAEEPIGTKVVFTIKKNKVGPPYGVGNFEIWNTVGVNKWASLLDTLVYCDIMKMKGSWFICDEKPFAQGRSNAIKVLMDNPDIYQELMGRII